MPGPRPASGTPPPDVHDRAGAAPIPGGRLAALDALRGLALGGMVIYHGVWDLAALGFTAADPAGVTLLRWLGNGVAAAFLLISGIALSLAERAGHGWPRTLGRIAVLALAAGVVTLGTWLAWPDLAVRFGILHCLAVTNALALGLRRVPNTLLVAAGVGCLALLLLWPWPLAAGWAWTGLSRDLPATLDFRPVFPWLGLVLVGRAAGRTALVGWLARVPVRSAAGRVADWAGRHSLALYLLHQPVMLALLALLAAAVGAPRPTTAAVAPSEAAAFLNACTRTCGTTQDAELCRATCHCVLTASALPETGLRGLLARVQDPQAKLRRAAELCR